ncbi:MAG: hypothetical protein R3A48_23850 [Polyangiales bacterium]
MTELNTVVHGARARLWARVGASASVLGLALYLRATQRPVVFLGGETIPLDTDCHYHMRRALRTLEGFPHVPPRDPWMNWPEGAVPTWGPGFDQLLALPAWLLGAREDPARAARIIAWVPPALGLLTVALTMGLARASDPDDESRDLTALAAGLFVAATPVSVLEAMVGRTDHHVFEALVTAAVALWCLRPKAIDTPLRVELAGAALVFATVHGFSGALLTWGLATGALLLRALFGEVPRGARGALPGSGGPALLLGAAAITAVDGRWILSHGQPFHHLTLSFLQPALLAAGGVAVCVATLIAGRLDGGAGLGRAARRGGITLAALLPAAALAALLAPTVAHEVREGLVQWLATRDPWMGSIQETQSLLSGGLRGALDDYGALALTTPVLLPLALRRASRRGLDAALSLALLGVGTLLLTLLQRRFGRANPPMLALWTALGLAELAELARGRISLGRKALVWVPAALALAWCALDPEPRALFARVRGQWITGGHEAALFLRDLPPRRAVRGERPAVFAHWTLGFEAMFLGRRPALVTGFGPYASRATWAALEPTWRGDEAGLVSALDGRDARYWMFPSAAFLSQRSPRGERAVKRSARGRLVVSSEFLREVPVAAAVLGGSGAAQLGVRHFESLRPIFVDHGRVQGLSTAVPTHWVYERVRGARLEGDAPQGGPVVVSIPLALRDIRRRWEALATVRGGRWSVRVPLPTGWATRGGVSTAGRYTVTARGRVVAEVVVTERAVRDGETVVVPPEDRARRVERGGE